MSQGLEPLDPTLLAKTSTFIITTYNRMAGETTLVRKTRQLGKSVPHLLLYLLPITMFHLQL